jgi:hypothetical protein
MDDRPVWTDGEDGQPGVSRYDPIETPPRRKPGTIPMARYAEEIAKEPPEPVPTHVPGNPIPRGRWCYTGCGAEATVMLMGSPFCNDCAVQHTFSGARFPF